MAAWNGQEEDNDMNIGLAPMTLDLAVCAMADRERLAQEHLLRASARRARGHRGLGRHRRR